MVREDDGPKVPHRQPTGQYINDVVLGYTQQDLARDQQPAITVDQVQRAQQFPEIGVSASASRDSGANGPANESYALQGGISAFELDLFGRLASATEAERQRALASESAARTVRLGLVADLASAWALHAADAELLRIAEDTAMNARRSVTLTRALLQGGVAPRIDVRQAEQILAVAEADVAAQKTALAQDRNLIQLLVGAPIDAAMLSDRLEDAGQSYAAPQAGLSSQVLLRRPDVNQAERQLRAANAEIGVARARLFPQISLTGLLGLASGALGSLFDSDAFHTTLGGSARQAIFSGGGVRAGVAVSEAQRDAALAAYEKAIQTAFREVADALARRGTIADQLRAVSANAAAAADVARLTEARYRGGVTSSLDNLDAQRSQYAARRQDVAMRLVDVQNRVALYRVLGGDIATVAER